MGKPLSSDAIAEFHENGLLVYDLIVDEALLDTIVARTLPMYEAAFQANPTFPTRLIDAWKLIDQVRQLAVLPEVLEALEQLFGRKALPFQTLNFPIGTGQSPHADTIHFNSIPAGFMAGVWVALEDIDDDNGPLEYFPGSHKLPEKTMQDFGLRADIDDYPHYEAALAEMIRSEAIAVRYGKISKGQAIIWHANLVHGGAGQRDLNRSRHSQVSHYFFADCQYYTPMLSSPDKPALRKPVWIPSEFDPEITQKAKKQFENQRRREEQGDRFSDRLADSLRAIKRKLGR